MNKNIVSELFGREELSDDYLNLLKNYQMTKEEGISIRDETIKSVLPFNRHGTYEDYEMMMITVDEFRKRFSDRFREIHNSEINDGDAIAVYLDDEKVGYVANSDTTNCTNSSKASELKNLADTAYAQYLMRYHAYHLARIIK